MDRDGDLKGDGYIESFDVGDKRLHFLTDFRPRARYLRWIYLNAVLNTAWGSYKLSLFRQIT